MDLTALQEKLYKELDNFGTIKITDVVKILIGIDPDSKDSEKTTDDIKRSIRNVLDNTEKLVSELEKSKSLKSSSDLLSLLIGVEIPQKSPLKAIDQELVSNIYKKLLQYNIDLETVSENSESLFKLQKNVESSLTEKTKNIIEKLSGIGEFNLPESFIKKQEERIKPESGLELVPKNYFNEDLKNTLELYSTSMAPIIELIHSLVNYSNSEFKSIKQEPKLLQSDVIEGEFEVLNEKEEKNPKKQNNVLANLYDINKEKLQEEELENPVTYEQKPKDVVVTNITDDALEKIIKALSKMQNESTNKIISDKLEKLLKEKEEEGDKSGGLIEGGLLGGGLLGGIFSRIFGNKRTRGRGVRGGLGRKITKPGKLMGLLKWSTFAVVGLELFGHKIIEITDNLMNAHGTLVNFVDQIMNRLKPITDVIETIANTFLAFDVLKMTGVFKTLSKIPRIGGLISSIETAGTAISSLGLKALGAIAAFEATEYLLRNFVVTNIKNPGLQNAAGALTDIAAGAAAGATFGPQGALIGGIAGGAFSIGKNIYYTGKEWMESMDYEKKSKEAEKDMYERLAKKGISIKEVPNTPFIQEGGKLKINPNYHNDDQIRYNIERNKIKTIEGEKPPIILKPIKPKATPTPIPSGYEMPHTDFSLYPKQSSISIPEKVAAEKTVEKIPFMLGLDDHSINLLTSSIISGIASINKEPISISTSVQGSGSGGNSRDEIWEHKLLYKQRGAMI